MSGSIANWLLVRAHATFAGQPVRRAPPFSAPLQARWLANALRYLGQGESRNSKES